MDSVDIGVQVTSSSVTGLHSSRGDHSSTSTHPLMADQASVKKTLSQLSRREDLNNKICCDCSNPNPQWASLRYHNVNLTKIFAN
jgi:hypothetical protein